jgi:uncharacterized coiled-coil protein SlyX
MSTEESRLVDLELRYMQLDRLVDELSSVVAEQSKLIDRLRADLAALAARQLGGGEGEMTEIDPVQSFERDRPPHY